MTALATIYLQKIILMSADSLELELDSYESRVVIGTTQSQKLFFIQKSGTGIVVSGYSAWQEKNIRQILMEFSEIVGSYQPTQADVAGDLCEFLTKGYAGLRGRFHLGGFDGDEPFVAELEHSEDFVWQFRRKNLDSKGLVLSSILAMCERETIHHVNHRTPCFESLSIRDALEVLKDLYEFEIRLVQSKKSPPDVGEPIDILVMFPGGHWFHSAKSLEQALLD